MKEVNPGYTLMNTPRPLNRINIIQELSHLGDTLRAPIYLHFLSRPTQCSLKQLPVLD